MTKTTRVVALALGLWASAARADGAWTTGGAVEAGHERSRMNQPEQRDAWGQITVEDAVIHVVECDLGPRRGRSLYVYEYTRRPGFRAIQPPDWARPLGGRDFATYGEALAAACDVEAWHEERHEEHRWGWRSPMEQREREARFEPPRPREAVPEVVTETLTPAWPNAPLRGRNARETGMQYQGEQVDAEGRITVEQSVIHSVVCGDGASAGQELLIYEYVRRPGFRAIRAPEWSRPLGGRDFPTFDEAVDAACGPPLRTVYAPPTLVVPPPGSVAPPRVVQPVAPPTVIPAPRAPQPVAPPKRPRPTIDPDYVVEPPMYAQPETPRSPPPAPPLPPPAPPLPPPAPTPPPPPQTLRVPLPEAPESPPPPLPPTGELIDVFANRTEPMESRRLVAGALYELVVTGTYATAEDRADAMDAMYCFGAWRCPTPEPWGPLLVDGRPLAELARAANASSAYRPDHRYVVRIRGTGRPLGLSIADARSSAEQNRGALAVHIRRVD